jgi:hypothetical protein
MPNSLSQRIAERVKAENMTASGKNRAAFLALRDDIQGALDDGWPIKTVWETLRKEGKVGCSYETFIRYVKRLIGPKAQPRPAVVSMPGLAPTEQNKMETAVSHATARKPPNVIPGFAFNPSLRKEDLI